ncbi:hypothetical protein [Neptuniibacter sp.]|uniref:hypothetical protein n=1 Tax=Neptuniibacter sp. TaxID=1962643 RepID=UPI003B5BFE57
MAVVWCDIHQIVSTNDDGYDVDSVYAECKKCGAKSDEIWGTSETSINRALMNLKESCPKKENNFYKESKF